MLGADEETHPRQGIKLPQLRLRLDDSAWRPIRTQVRKVRLRTIANLKRGTSIQRRRGRPVVYISRCVERLRPGRPESHCIAHAALVSTLMVRSATPFDAGWYGTVVCSLVPSCS